CIYYSIIYISSSCCTLKITLYPYTTLFRSAQEEEQIKKEADQVKKQLEETTVDIPAKSGDDGRLFGSITSKQIAEHLKKQHKITVDRRKIELQDPLKSLGHHKVAVKLHPDVTGTITVQVVEQ